MSFSTKKIKLKRNEKINTGKSLTSVLLVSAITHASNTYAIDTRVSTSLANDVTNKGISVTNEETTLGLYLDVSFDSGWFLGLQNYMHQASGNENRKGFYHFYTGYFAEFGEDSAYSFSYSRYEYNADFFRSWDYDELRLDYHWSQELNFNLAYSNNYYGRDWETIYTEVSWQPQISEDYFATFTYGNLFVSDSSLLDSSENWSAGITRNFERLSLSARYHDANDNLYPIHGYQNTGSRWIFELNYQLY